MRWVKWIGLLASVVLAISCLMPWVIVTSKDITISGIDATGTNFGKPGYFHFVALFFFLLFTFLQKIWAKRSNLIVGALNFAWAVRNYFLITMCRGGECPEKKLAIYLVVAASLVMLLSALFPDMKMKKTETETVDY